MVEVSANNLKLLLLFLSRTSLKANRIISTINTIKILSNCEFVRLMNDENNAEINFIPLNNINIVIIINLIVNKTILYKFLYLI